jgi:hypothetical protein
VRMPSVFATLVGLPARESEGMRYVPFTLIAAGVAVRVVALAITPEPTFHSGLADLCLWLGLAAALLLAPPRRRVVAAAIAVLVAAALAFFLVGLVEQTHEPHRLAFAFRPLTWVNAAESMLLAAAGCAIAAPRLSPRAALPSFAALALASIVLFGVQHGSHEGSAWLFLSSVYWLPLFAALGVAANQR